MIYINHINKSFNGKKVLDDISIHIKPGIIHGLIGENGTGKSTIIQCLAGIYKPDDGEVKVDGESVYENPKVKQKIAYVADRNQYFEHYTIEQLIKFFKQAYHTFNEKKFHTYNEVFKLSLKTKVRNLSKGMQMRLSLMLNLAICPKVLILDEPTSGLDALAKKQVLDFIIDEVNETGMTVLISSHHLSEIERVCDDITMLSYEKIVYQSSVEALKTKVRKLQVVFKESAPDDLDQWEHLLNVEKIGRVYYIVTDNYSEELHSRLSEAGAFLIESIGLDLEEVFIYTALDEKGKR